LILIGDTAGHLGASRYLREIEGRDDGAPPPVDLVAERKNGDFVRGEIAQGHVVACHDLSDGGLLIALAEMAMAGNNGAALDPPPPELPLCAWLFGEDQARYLIETPDADAMLRAAAAAGVLARRVARVAGHGADAALTLPGAGVISVGQLKAANEAWLPGYMTQG
jgi:phosphoribosylformylglycinamidine synthase subunit PurL